MKATRDTWPILGWLAYAVVAVALATFLVELVRDGEPSVVSVVLALAGLGLMAVDAMQRRRSDQLVATPRDARAMAAALAVTGLGAVELTLGVVTDRRSLVMHGLGAVVGGAVVASVFFARSRRRHA